MKIFNFHFLLKDIDYKVQPLLLFIMLIGVITQVLNRFIPELRAPWALEFNTFMFSTFVWIGLSISIKENSQVGLTIFTDFLPKKAREQFSVIQMLLFGIYLICVGFLAFKYLIYVYCCNINTPAMRAPMYIIRSPLVIGCALSLYRIVERLVSLHKNRLIRRSGVKEERILSYKTKR